MSGDDGADERDQTETTGDTESRTTADRVRRGVDYLLLAGLALFALVAAVGFYTSVQGVVRTWVTAEFRPFATAAFNLAVLLAVAAGLRRQVRRLG